MFPSKDRRIPSPDGRFEALLHAMGPTPRVFMRAGLSLAGLSFRDRAFACQGVWSPCSRYFSIMEWCHDGALAMPVSRLLLIDLQGKKECAVDRIESGLVEPLRLYDGKVRYVRIDLRAKAKRIIERPIGGSVIWTGMGDESAAVLNTDR